jgi:predicted nucleotidyltransferase
MLDRSLLLPYHPVDSHLLLPEKESNSDRKKEKREVFIKKALQFMKAKRTEKPLC